MSQVRKMQQGGKVRKNGRELTGQAAYDWLQQNLAGVGNGETHTIAEKALNDGNTFDINADGSWYVRDAQGNDVSSNYVGDSFAKASDSRFKKVLGATFNSKNHNNRLESDALAKATIVDPAAAAAASQANTKTALRRGSGWFDWGKDGQFANSLNNNTAFSILDNIGTALNAENFDGYDLTGWNEQSLKDAKEYLKGNPEWLNQLKERIQRNAMNDDDKQLLNAFGFVEPEKTAAEQAIADQELYNKMAGDAYRNGNNQALDGIMGVVDDGQGNQVFGLADPDALRQALGLKPGQNAFFGDYFKLAGYDHLKNKYLIGNKIYDPANEADRDFIETFITNSKFAELNEKGNYGASDGIIKWNWEDSVRPWATGSAAQYISPWQADKLYEGVNWANASTTYNGQALQPGQQIVRYAANNTQRDINGFVRPEDIKYAIIDDKGFKIADGLSEEDFENLGEGKDDEGNIIGINFEKRLTNDQNSPYYDKYKEEVKSGNPDDPVAMTAYRTLDGSGDVEVQLSDALMPESAKMKYGNAITMPEPVYQALKNVVKNSSDASADSQEALKSLISSLYQSGFGWNQFNNSNALKKIDNIKALIKAAGASDADAETLMKYFMPAHSSQFVKLRSKDQRQTAKQSIISIPGEILSNKQGGEIPSMQMGGIAVNTGITTGNHSVIKKAESKNDYRKFGVMGDGDHGADMSSGDKLEFVAFALDCAGLVASFAPGVGSAAALGAGLGSMGLDMAARKRKGEKMSGKSIATGLALAASSVIPGAKAGKLIRTASKFAAAGLIAPGVVQALHNMTSGKMTAEDLHILGVVGNMAKAEIGEAEYKHGIKKIGELTKGSETATATEAVQAVKKPISIKYGEGEGASVYEGNLDMDIITKVKNGDKSMKGKTPGEIAGMLKEALKKDLEKATPKGAKINPEVENAIKGLTDNDILEKAGLTENFGKTFGFGKATAKADATPGFVSKAIDKVKGTKVFGKTAEQEKAIAEALKNDKTAAKILEAYRNGDINKWVLGRYLQQHPEAAKILQSTERKGWGWGGKRYDVTSNKQKYSSPTISEEKVDAGKAVVKTASEAAPVEYVNPTPAPAPAPVPQPEPEPMSTALTTTKQPVMPSLEELLARRQRPQVPGKPQIPATKSTALTTIPGEGVRTTVKDTPQSFLMRWKQALEDPDIVEDMILDHNGTALTNAARARYAALRGGDPAKAAEVFNAFDAMVKEPLNIQFKQGGVIKAQSGVQVPKLPDLTADIDAGVNTSVNAAYNRTMNMLEKLPTINTQKAPSIVAPSRMKDPSTITRKRGANGGGSENGLQVDPVAYLDWKHMKDQNRAADEYGNMMEKTINDSVVQTPYTRLQRMRSGLSQMANNTNMAIAGMRSQAGINESADDRRNLAQNLATEGQIAQARLGEAQQASAQYNQEQAQNAQIANQEMQMNAQNYANNAQRQAQARAAIGELKAGVFQKKRDNEHAWKQTNLSRLKQLKDITAETDAQLALYNDMATKRTALNAAAQKAQDAWTAYNNANKTSPLSFDTWAAGVGAQYKSAMDQAQADIDRLNLTAQRDAALAKQSGNAYGWLVRSKKGGKMRDPINDMAVNAHRANLKASELLDKEVLKLISQLVK